MNKQILDKLRTETDIWCDENFPDHPLYDAKWEERFAELIVEECAHLLINEAERNYDEDSMTYMTLIEEANWFRIYFGIE